MKILKGEVLDVQGFSATIDEKTKTLTIGANLQNAEHSNYRIFINDKEKLAYAGEKLIDWKKAFNAVTNEYAVQMREVNNQLREDHKLGDTWIKVLDEAISYDSNSMNQLSQSKVSNGDNNEWTEVTRWHSGNTNDKNLLGIFSNDDKYELRNINNSSTKTIKELSSNEALRLSVIDGKLNSVKDALKFFEPTTISVVFKELFEDFKNEDLSQEIQQPLQKAELNINPDETLLLKLYDKSEIPSKVLGHELSEKQISLLCRGEIVRLSGISLDGQEKRDIGIKMQSFLDENKEVKKGLMFSIKSKVLEIPDKILDHTLSPEEKQSLKQGEFVGIVKDEKNFLVSVNQKTNSVVVNVPAELGIKEELGGYKFNKEELAYLANGKELPTRLFKSEKHGYYTAELKIMKEGNQVSYQFNNVASVSPAEAKKLANELNNHLLPSEDTANKVIDTVFGQEKGASLNEKDSTKAKTGGEVKKPLESLKTPAKKTR